MKRLRDFERIVALLGEREIDELQAAIDARREARAAQDDTSRDVSPTQAGAAGWAPRKGRRAS